MTRGTACILIYPVVLFVRQPFPASIFSPPSDHCDGRDVDGVQTLQSLPGNAQEPQIKISRGEMVWSTQSSECRVLDFVWKFVVSLCFSWQLSSSLRRNCLETETNGWSLNAGITWRQDVSPQFLFTHKRKKWTLEEEGHSVLFFFFHSVIWGTCSGWCCRPPALLSEPTPTAVSICPNAPSVSSRRSLRRVSSSTAATAPAESDPNSKPKQNKNCSVPFPENRLRRSKEGKTCRSVSSPTSRHPVRRRSQTWFCSALRPRGSHEC